MPGATSWCHNSAPSVHFVHAHNHNEHYSASLFQRLKLHKYKTVFDIRWDMHNLKSCQNTVKKRYFALLLHMQRQKDILGVYLSVDWSQRGRNEWENSCSMKKKILIITESIAEIKECLFCVLKYPRKYCSISFYCSKGKRGKDVPASTSLYTWKYHCIYRMTKTLKIFQDAQADILCFKYNRNMRWVCRGF